MSQLVQPKLTVPGQLRSNQWLVPMVITLVALALMAFAIVVGGDKAANFAVDQPQQALRPGGGPEESAVAASLTPPATPTAPVESRIAAAVASGAEDSPAEPTGPRTIPIGPLGR